MKILIYSDIHLEFSHFEVPSSGYDAVVLAGDIGLGSEGAKWAVQSFPDKPVIYICGNHEYYHHSVEEVHDSIRQVVTGSNVHFCENDSVWIDGVRFIAATFWTDFALLGDAVMAKVNAQFGMNDYRMIGYSNRILQADDTQKFHTESRRYLESEFTCDIPAQTKSVVVTHHAPSKRSLKYERINDYASPAYASVADDLVLQSGAQLWIHGHTHEPADYKIGHTRVVSNPRGYSHKISESTNPGFNRLCIIEI